MVYVVVKQKVCLKMEAVNYGRLFIKMWKLKKNHHKLQKKSLFPSFQRIKWK